LESSAAVNLDAPNQQIHDDELLAKALQRELRISAGVRLSPSEFIYSYLYFKIFSEIGGNSSS